jgi:DmsE family decaheme c-type cytochrome
VNDAHNVRSPKRRRSAFWPWILVLLPALLLAPAGPHSRPGAQDKQDKPKTAPFPREGEYKGTAVCLDCHEPDAELLNAGYHGLVLTNENHKGCESCHGPGAAHADHIDNDPMLISHPSKLGWDVLKAALCGTCHADQIRDHRGDLEGFLATGRNCTDCHKVHKKKTPAPFPTLDFESKAAMTGKSRPAGSASCITCHPLRNNLLTESIHHALDAKTNAQGCETCHGPGGNHVRAAGLARLITRPDKATDGIATCRTCHENVDPVTFHHRKEGDAALLGDNLSCTTCHKIHVPVKKVEPVPPLLRPPGEPPVEPPDAGSGGGTAGGEGSEGGGSGERGDGEGQGLQVEAPVTSSSMASAIDRTQTAAAPTNALCAQCHAPAFPFLHGTVHESLGPLATPLGQGCGGCHPGGPEHAESGGRRDLIESMAGTDAATQQQICGQCHQDDEALHRSPNGAHARNEVTCLTCHSPTAPKGSVREDASRRCATCHAPVQAQFELPNHHPVQEGGMDCVDCHEPHGARTKGRDRDLRQGRCVTCHTQYAGPFVFAHQASRIDGCMACHTPHGGVNKRMLKTPTSQQSCLQCHGDFPAFHDQTSGAVFTNCLNCHTEVHGSNHSRYLFR